MLLIDHTIGASPIHGFGVFAKGFVRAGTKVIEFNPVLDLLIQPAQLRAMPAHAADRIRRHGFFCDRLRLHVLPSDGSAWLNHSDQPNLLFRDLTAYVRRDIHPGEELTCDYGREVHNVAWREAHPSEAWQMTG